MTEPKPPDPPAGSPRQHPKQNLPREPWVDPKLTELPPLAELTLQSGPPIGGGGNTGGGGSTVF